MMMITTIQRGLIKSSTSSSSLNHQLRSLSSTSSLLISKSKVLLQEGEENKKNSEESSIRSSNPYSRFRDAYEPSFLSTSNSLNSSDLFNSNHHNTSLPRKTKRQTLTNAEAATFASLLENILPDPLSRTGGNNVLDSFRNGLMNSSNSGSSVASKISKALTKSASGTRAMWERRARTSLTTEEEVKLDGMRELMVSFRTDLDLLSWSMWNVFGFPTTTSTISSNVFPDPRTSSLPQATYNNSVDGNLDSGIDKVGPASPLYPELLVILFLLLRDTHRSPHSALHIFSLASTTAQSYVLGCTTTLYNEVLRTKWMEGDVETVSSGLEEMISGGIKIDDGTKSIISAIGEAIRIDESRAERRAIELEGEISLGDQVSQENLDKYRFFSPAQIRAWAKMERIVQESDEEASRKKLAKEEEKTLVYEAKRARDARAEIVEARNASPDMFFSPTLVQEKEAIPHYEARDRGGDDFGSGMSLSDRRREGSRENERYLNREERVGYNFSGDRASSRRSNPISTITEEDDNDDKIDSSWNNFPLEVFPRRATSTTSTASSSTTRSISSFSRGEKDSSSLYDSPIRSDKPVSPPSTRKPNKFDLIDTDGYESSEEGDSFYTPARAIESRTRPELASDNVARIVNGVIVLPKRPSFANPFKLRRKSLTKAEKSRKDTVDPRLAWKKSAV